MAIFASNGVEWGFALTPTVNDTSCNHLIWKVIAKARSLLNEPAGAGAIDLNIRFSPEPKGFV